VQDQAQKVLLGERSPLTLDERVDYRAADDLVFINLEGLTLDTLEEAEELAAFVGLRLHDLGRRVNLIVNYDNFELRRSRPATEAAALGRAARARLTIASICT
jgi:hypothetical protein